MLVCSREVSFSNVLKNWFGNMYGRFLLHASFFSKLLDILRISKPSFLDRSCSRLMSVMLWTLSAAVLIISFGSYFAEKEKMRGPLQNYFLCKVVRNVVHLEPKVKVNQYIRPVKALVTMVTTS